MKGSRKQEINILASHISRTNTWISDAELREFSFADSSNNQISNYDLKIKKKNVPPLHQILLSLRLKFSMSAPNKRMGGGGGRRGKEICYWKKKKNKKQKTDKTVNGDLIFFLFFFLLDSTFLRFLKSLPTHPHPHFSLFANNFFPLPTLESAQIC